MEKLIFEKSKAGRKGYTLPKKQFDYCVSEHIPEKYLRKSELNLPELCEGDISRHYTKLAHLNYSIEEGLYPLGSCTMKYNPKVNEKTSSLAGFTELHPCIGDESAQGALELMFNLGNCLKEICGMPGVSLQPSAGSNGEFTGILTFRAYHLANGDTKRTKILIPDSAHGTNPASAVIAGFKTVNVKSNDKGRIDLEDLKSKCGDDVAGFMVTNPSTLGLFETEIVEIEKLIHGCGGLMYMDGANLNALLGIARPGDMKFDCVHMNLHKTFSTPHGGGGPGSGPICVSEKLVPFLPKPQIVKENGKFKLNYDLPQSIGKIHSFYGNFGVLVRALTYIYMCGAEGMRRISENAIISANYILSKLKDEYEIPHYEYCMHEFVLSCDRQKEHGFNAKDIAKRLLDYGYHAPTIYFPLIVREAMLIEPTETETLEALRGFSETMLKISQEGKENLELLTKAPFETPVRRLDDALAARNLNLAWK